MNQIDIKNNDLETLFKIDELMEDIELKIQKGISLVKLNVNPSEAFSEYYEGMDKVVRLANAIDDVMIQTIVANKILDMNTRFNEKLKQIR